MDKHNHQLIRRFLLNISFIQVIYEQHTAFVWKDTTKLSFESVRIFPELRTVQFIALG